MNLNYLRLLIPCSRNCRPDPPDCITNPWSQSAKLPLMLAFGVERQTRHARLVSRPRSPDARDTSHSCRKRREGPSRTRTAGTGCVMVPQVSMPTLVGFDSWTSTFSSWGRPSSFLLTRGDSSCRLCTASIGRTTQGNACYSQSESQWEFARDSVRFSTSEGIRVQRRVGRLVSKPQLVGGKPKRVKRRPARIRWGFSTLVENNNWEYVWHWSHTVIAAQRRQR